MPTWVDWLFLGLEILLFASSLVSALKSFQYKKSVEKNIDSSNASYLLDVFASLIEQFTNILLFTPKSNDDKSAKSFLKSIRAFFIQCNEANLYLAKIQDSSFKKSGARNHFSEMCKDVIVSPNQAKLLIEKMNGSWSREFSSAMQDIENEMSRIEGPLLKRKRH